MFLPGHPVGWSDPVGDCPTITVAKCWVPLLACPAVLFHVGTPSFYGCIGNLRTNSKIHGLGRDAPRIESGAGSACAP